MKKKLIQNLLMNRHADDLRERIAEVISGTGTHGQSIARQVLADAVEVSQKQERLDPAELYFTVCSSTAAQFVAFLQGTKSEETPPRSLAIAQGILNDVLTSKAGRKKTSGVSRQEQLAEAQSRRREKIRVDHKRVDIWITPEAANNLATIQREHACKSQAEAIELALAAAVEGRILKPVENA